MLVTDAEVEESGICDLNTWYPSDTFTERRITSTDVTGRDFFRC